KSTPMKKPFALTNGLVCWMSILSLALWEMTLHVSAQNPPPNQPTPEQQAARLKEKWTKPLTDARQEFQNSNDRESVEFTTGILDSLERPGGMSPTALAGNLTRIRNQVRELIRRGALESAACLNWAQWRILSGGPSGPSGPLHPNRKTGGSPGPSG